MNNTSSDDRIMTELQSEPLLRDFFNDSFDHGAFVRNLLRDSSGSALEESAVERTLHTIRQRAGQVDSAIRDLVAHHQDALVLQASSSTAMKHHLTRIGETVASAEEGLSRLRTDVLEPYNRIKSDIRVLGHATSALDLLRRVQRAHHSIRRLRALAGTASDSRSPGPSAGSSSSPSAPLDVRTMTRLAPILYDVSLIFSDESICGLALLAQDSKHVAAIAETVLLSARSLLVRAVETLNAADVASAVSILHDLRCLPTEAEAVVLSCLSSTVACITEALDTRLVAAAAQSALEGGAGTAAIVSSAAAGKQQHSGQAVAAAALTGTRGPALVPPAGAAAAWRGVLWGRVEAMCEAFQRITLQVWNLAYVLSRSRDSENTTALAMDLSSDPTIAAEAALILVPGDVEHGDTSAFACRLVDPEPGLLHPSALLLRRYWRETCCNLEAQLRDLVASESSTFIRGTLIDAYPRIHYLFLDVCARAARSVSLRATGEGSDVMAHIVTRSRVGHGQTFSHSGGKVGPLLVQAAELPVGGLVLFTAACPARGLVWALGPLLKQYLTRSFSRLNAAMASMFPVHSGPSAAAAQGQPRKAQRKATPSSDGSLFFTSTTDMETYADECVAEAPSTAATAAYIKAIQVELAACRPPASAAYASATSSGRGPVTEPSLVAAVCRTVSQSLRLLSSRADAACAGLLTGSAVAVADHCVPTPSQQHNLSLAARLDDLRIAVIALSSDLPLPAQLAELLPLDDGGSIAVIASERTRMYPLRPRMPPPLLAAAHLLKVGRGTREGDLVSQSPHGLLAAALEEIDCVVDKLLLPWLAAVAVPVDGLMSRLHSGSYIEPQGSVAGATESPFAAALERYCEGLAGYQLRVLGTSTVAETVRKALASRVLTLFVRHASMVRPLDDSGRQRLARDAAQVESSVSLLFEPTRLGRAYAELRAFRPFLFLSMTDLAAAVALGSGADLSVQEQQRRSKISTMLRSLRASSLLQALTARLPRECSMPHAFTQMSPGQYSALLDSAALEAHLRGIDTAPIPDSCLPVLRLFVGESGFAAADEVVWRLTLSVLEEYEKRVQATPGGNPAVLADIPEYRLLLDHGEALVQLARASCSGDSSTA